MTVSPIVASSPERLLKNFPSDDLAVTKISLQARSCVLACSHALRRVSCKHGIIASEEQKGQHVNGRAEILTTRIPIARAEHIALEASPEDTHPASRRVRRKVRLTYSLKSPLHGCHTDLALLEDHFLAVRCLRPGEPPKQYDVDLRFANAQPVRVRAIAWTWLIVTIGLLALAAATIVSVLKSAADPWARPGFIAAWATLGISIGTFMLFLRRTTESLEFRSVHGQATLVSVTGGIGSTRNGKRFFVELIKDIHAAKATRPPEKQHFLRDEMREHHRLRELGALSKQEYEASKARILRAHD